MKVFHKLETRYHVESTLHEKVIAGLAKKLKEKYEINQLDGIKISINENTWSLIRKIKYGGRHSEFQLNQMKKRLLEKIQKEMIANVKNCYEEIK